MALGGSSSVLSSDRTRIAYDRVGEGPALILVEPALHFRDFSAFGGLTDLLAEEFMVLTYDRRGRGESTNTLPYSPDREVEDLAALINAVGGTARVYAYSSGALLALRAAARGLPIIRLAVLEPPLQDDEAPRRPDPLTEELAALTSAGRHADAVVHFHRSIGVPDQFIAEMRGTSEWAKMESVAPTMVYDCMISDETDASLLSTIETPTLVLDSEGSTHDLTGWAARVAALVPGATHRSLPGEWHGVPDETLAPALTEFFGGDAP